MATPRPGEPFEPGGTLTTDPWWRPFGGTIDRHWHTATPAGPEAKQSATPAELDLASER